MAAAIIPQFLYHTSLIEAQVILPSSTFATSHVCLGDVCVAAAIIQQSLHFTPLFTQLELTSPPDNPPHMYMRCQCGRGSHPGQWPQRRHRRWVLNSMWCMHGQRCIMVSLCQHCKYLALLRPAHLKLLHHTCSSWGASMQQLHVPNIV